MSSKMVKDAKLQFDRFVQDVVVVHKEEFLEFDYANKGHRLDAFYFTYLPGKSAYSSFSESLKIILTLSHGQAAVERGFSINKSILVDNLKTESLSSQRIVHDHMNVHDIESHEIIISPELRKSVRSSRQRYNDFCQEQKKNAKDTEQARKRKMIEDNVADVKRKRLTLSSTIKELEEGADKFATEAENSESFEDMKILLAKSNSFRANAKEKLN